MHTIGEVLWRGSSQLSEVGDTKLDWNDVPDMTTQVPYDRCETLKTSSHGSSLTTLQSGTLHVATGSDGASRIRSCYY